RGADEATRAKELDVIMTLSTSEVKPNPAGPDAEEVRRALAVICGSVGTYFFQALPSARWRYHLAEDAEGVLATAGKLAPGQKGFYFGINPCRPGRKKAQKDEDIVFRSLLMFDIDPVRPADSNATDQEHQAALDAAGAAQAWLTGKGWPDPVCVDTGN